VALTRLKSPDAAARWLREWVTGTLRSDSRRVKPGDAFIAWPGHATDGRRFVRAALDAGAATCLVEDEGVDAFGFDDARIATLPRMKAATGHIASAFFDRPSGALEMVAVTGTNGKTSSAWWTAQALSLLGRDCGVVGTLGIGQPPLPARAGSIEHTGLTTPDPVLLHAALRRFVSAGFEACAMEASSIGIVEHRMAGVQVAVALFTNFTQDHLDYHGTMDAYWAAKRALFEWPGLRAAVINIDDAKGATLAAELAAAGSLDVWTVSRLGASARLVASDLGYDDGGLAFTVHEGSDSVRVRSALTGDYNASNLLGVFGVLRASGATLESAANIVPMLTPVPGRMQRVGAAGDGPDVVVDYAHTPDALDKAIRALHPLAAARGGRLWCVFGCGGNRDPGKRPLMGAVAGQLADRVVVTSDNPRHEPPAAIVAQVAAGIGRDDALVIEDRREAIARVVAEADARDVVLIAGKGHEDYQEIAGVRHPFSDADEAQAALQRRRAGA
jgi:UDP-N-acetylmuramoyl-L-alanyl-D-glutamate--2,6-diaminopimelate ligase